MLPNSFLFLAFLGLTVGAFYLLPHRYRWLMLLVASLYFYSTFEPVYLILLAAVTTVTWGVGLAVDNATEQGARKPIFVVGVVAVISALLVFKYYDFAVGSVEAVASSGWFGGPSLFPTFPRLDLVVFVGLSFYTFSCVSYLADVYERRMAAERHFGRFALYVAFFPKLLAGPIERSRPFLEQIQTRVRFDPRLFTLGLQLLLWGLFKKVVIADRLALFVDATYAQPMFASPADLVIATYFFAFQLYCDFSGYSDMAIGASMLFGIRLMENFRRPYLSTSTVEFWSSRWHLSLASWFRDYMYIPMGGSRVGRLRRYFNLMAVFMVSGLWHGANWTFVIWGGLNGFYNVVSQMTRGAREGITSKLPTGLARVGGILITFHLILVTWVFFRAASVGDAWTILQRSWAALPQLPELLVTRLAAGDVIFGFALIAVLLAMEVIDERKPLWDRLNGGSTAVRWGFVYALLAALLLIGTWQLNSFVYMQF